MKDDTPNVRYEAVATMSISNKNNNTMIGIQED